MGQTLRVTLNPLFAVEWRGRFRRLPAFAPLAGAVFAGALLLWFLIGANNAAMPSVFLARAQGLAILRAYRLWGGLLYAIIGVLVGAMSIVHEKNAGTFESLILCPLGARGIVRGKVCSALAFSLMIQVALLPLLAAMVAFCLLRPAQIGWVVGLHFALSAQGATLGILGAMRARTIGSAVAGALNWWMGLTMFLGTTAFFAAIFFAAIWVCLAMILGIFASAFGFTTTNAIVALGLKWAIAHLFPVGWALISALGGVTGLGAVADYGLRLPWILAGQIFGIYSLARWSAWQLHSPDRDFKIADAAAFRLFFFDFRWELRPAQIARFPLAETLRAAPVESRAATPKSATGKRIRLIQARWLRELNPVLWLDLQRCLSLRSPHPSAQLPLLLFAALGGSLTLAAGMAGLVSLLTQSSGNADVGEFYRILHGALSYFALACGPIFASAGYVIERRSMMLHELRLTLLSARGLWWGKLAARGVIPLVGALPGLMLIQFFADNMGENAPRYALLSEGLLLMSIAAASISVCLWLSYHAPNQLAAALWCLGWAIAWGGLVWSAPAGSWAWLRVLSPIAGSSLALCTLVHAGVALGASGSILWKLRRMGFG